MKTLYLLRHAKSSWDDPDLKDFERPLSKRGRRDAPRMGERFKSRGDGLQCIICSPAVRTKTTAKLFAEAIDYPADDIASNPELYFAGSGMFLKAASLLDDGFDQAMLVGHNPAITEFANLMTNAGIDNIPTAGLVKMSLDIDQWSDIEAGSAELKEFDYPKKLAD
ncbi:MAG: histidine phosphatase family protein [Gammaproteobacteria bacterium]